MSLSPPGQEPHCGNVPPRCLLPRQSYYGSCSSCQSRGIRGKGCARLFPSLWQALPFSPARGSAGPPALPPSAVATCPGAHSSFTSSTTCCSPQVSILLSHSQSAARKLGLIILGLVHVNVPFLPQERNSRTLWSPHIAFGSCLEWILLLVAGAPTEGNSSRIRVPALMGKDP